MPEATGPRNMSPFQLAMQRLWSRRAARLAGGGLLLWLLLALYAPFVAGEVALVWSDEQGFGLPILADLFNALSYPNIHDFLFNCAALLLPFWAIFAWLTRRRLGMGRRLQIGALALIAFAALCILPIFGGESLWRNRPIEQRTSVNAVDATEVSCLLPPIPHRPSATYSGAVLQGPGSFNKSTGAHFWLGTDESGRGVLARMIHGARISLTIGLVATGLSIIIGALIGGISGYFGGKVDIILQRITEIMMAFPAFILVLIIVAMTGRNIFIIMAVLGIVGWPGAARLVRGEFLAQAQREYVLAAQALGLPRWRIMFRHILPNIMAPLLIMATFGIAGAVLAESGLAFIGLGDPTAASWGEVLNQGRRNIANAWLIWSPGLAIFMLVSLLNILGNHLREALDPKAQAR